MKYDFDHVPARFGTATMKYDDKAFFDAFFPGLRLDQDTIRIMVADMDFQCPPAITEALKKTAEQSTFGYTRAQACPEFYRSVINWYKRRYHYDVPADAIVYAGGALDGVEQTIAAFSQPGDGVIVCCPVYSHFLTSIKTLGRRMVDCHLIRDEDGYYHMDWAAFEAACQDPANKVYALCSPDNPIGVVWPEEDLRRMGAICKENGVVLVSDEIHSDLVRKGVTHTPILAAVEDTSNIIMIGGPNKSFNLMGLHCAYSIIPDRELRQRYEAVHDIALPTPFALAAMVAAYDLCEDWLDQLNEYLDESLSMAVEFLHTNMPKAKVHIPDGTYVLWVDMSAYGLSLEELVYRMNTVANVCADLGITADPAQGASFIRICATCPHTQLLEGLQRLADVLSDHREVKQSC